jgi:hypothetical protein
MLCFKENAHTKHAEFCVHLYLPPPIFQMMVREKILVLYVGKYIM